MAATTSFALDADYRWALVVGSDLSYCFWILARDKQLNAAQRDEITARPETPLGIIHPHLGDLNRQDPTHGCTNAFATPKVCLHPTARFSGAKWERVWESQILL